MPAQPFKDSAPVRTRGLKIFDVFLYPVLTNFGVFAISVVATYLTSRGGQRNEKGELMFGRIGAFFQKRGDWLMAKFKSMGMTHNQADMSKMVFFSFVDGSLLAPVVKLFEDRREKIGRWIDKRLGTSPDDGRAYAAEPKQSWGSVLGGRLATSMIVVPTAVALEKGGLNDILFHNPGLKAGKFAASKPGIAKWFGKLDLPEVFKIGFFETFYTSVCTAGLYFSSRFFARVIGRKGKTQAPGEPSLTVKEESASPHPAPLMVTEESAIPHQTRAKSFTGTFAERHAASTRNEALTAGM